MYGYIYITTNKITGMKYIGRHTSPKFDDQYIGSGTDFSEAVEFYGKENFECHILESVNNVKTICDNIHELCESEKYYIDYYDCVNSEDFYNLVPGGSWHLEEGTFKRSNKFKKKISELNCGKVAMTKDNKKTWVFKDDVDNYLLDGYTIGWPKKERLPKTIGTNAPFKWMTKNNEFKKVSTDYWEEFLSLGWVFGGYKRHVTNRKGFIPTEATREKMSKSHIGHKNTPEAIKKQSDSMRGRIGISKDADVKYIHESELNNYLNDGWVVGLPLRLRSTSKEVVCYETNEHFSCIAAANKQYPKSGALKHCLRAKYSTTCVGYHWYFSDDIERKSWLEQNIKR